MIKIICDNCEETFEVDPREAGGKVPCPLCGDVNRVPAEAARPAPDRRTDAARAARDEPAEDGTEREICIVRPAMFRAHPFKYSLLVLLMLGGVVLAFAAGPVERLWDWLSWVGVIVAVGALVLWLKMWITAYWWVRVVISNKRTVRHEGIVKRHTTEVLHDHVRSVDIRQTFLQRLFRVGDVGIDSAGQDEIEIVVDNLPDPYEVKRIVDRYRAM